MAIKSATARDVLRTDPDWIDAQREYLMAGGTVTSARVARLQGRYARTLRKFEQAEADLSRALNKWSELRKTLRRLGRDLDKHQQENSPDGLESNSE